MPGIARRSRAGAAVTDLILNLFRLNNLLLTAGDRLVAGFGLTSARWQILGAIVAAEHSRPVAWLARDLGANRQNVQRITNDLHAAGLVAFEPNPHHRRAPLVVLTEQGTRVFDAAMRLQVPWVNKLAQGLQSEDLRITHEVLLALHKRLAGGAPGSGPAGHRGNRRLG